MTISENKLTKTQEEFKRFYDENLQYKYEKLEPVRKECLKFFWISAFLYIFFLISFYWIMNNSANYISEFIKNTFSSKAGDTIFIGINLIFIGFCYYPILMYGLETKSLVMEKILSFWGNFRYKKDKILPYYIEKSELFNVFDDITTDDSFSGKYKETDINVSEIELSKKDGKYSTMIFKGIIILLDFNKKFKGKTIVRDSKNIFNKKNTIYFLIFFIVLSIYLIYLLSKKKYSVLAGIVVLFSIFLFHTIVYILRKTAKNKNKQNIHLEEITFNKSWNILSDDQIEARYILTPVLMEKINEIKRLYKGKYIDFSFFENKMMIAIHTRKNMFETTSLFKPSLEYKKVKEVVYQLYSIFSIINILNNKKD